eukprot:CAMPEP_0197546972 /NCGR_PEP_ID=MMETSP1320-20131121/1442_1 /TAXON_ID=91990 /ORGANISM="Bolidomonas sp., Strain RCC2347" /LENGTH=122 /DNA_ID=CAMNT_0043106651 /DNA_START=85 /DNA_END=449 /DNA_ORIENTATION=-
MAPLFSKFIAATALLTTASAFSPNVPAFTAKNHMKHTVKTTYLSPLQAKGQANEYDFGDLEPKKSKKAAAPAPAPPPPVVEAPPPAPKGRKAKAAKPEPVYVPVAEEPPKRKSRAAKAAKAP